MSKWKNKKTGETYIIISDEIINASNGSMNGQLMVLYQREKGGDQFVRDHEEFFIKFELIDDE